MNSRGVETPFFKVVTVFKGLLRRESPITVWWFLLAPRRRCELLLAGIAATTGPNDRNMQHPGTARPCL